MRIVSPFFFPLPVVCEILALGLALLWFTRKQKTGKVLDSRSGIASSRGEWANFGCAVKVPRATLSPRRPIVTACRPPGFGRSLVCCGVGGRLFIRPSD